MDRRGKLGLTEAVRPPGVPWLSRPRERQEAVPVLSSKSQIYCVALLNVSYFMFRTLVTSIGSEYFFLS